MYGITKVDIRVTDWTTERVHTMTSRRRPLLKIEGALQQLLLQISINYKV